jgi:HemY protein
VKLLLTSLLALLVAIAAGVLLSGDSGRVLLVIGGWTVQMSAGVFAVTAVMVIVVGFLVMRFLIALLFLPRSLRQRSGIRRLRLSEQHLSNGMRALAEGDWKRAEQAFRKGAAYSRAPQVNYLFAAQAAQRQGAGDRREQYLRQLRDGGDGAVALGLARAELQLVRNQPEQARATLRELDAQHPGRPRVQALLLDAAMSRGDWSEALALLDNLEKRRVLPPERIGARRLEAWSGLLTEAARSGSHERLEGVWQSIPGRLRRDLRLIEIYVGARLQFPDTADCEVLLRSVLKRHWDAGLAALYGRVQGRDAAKQLRTAEGWLSEHPRDTALLLALGRLCRRGGLWGKARNYLEEALKQGPNPEACRELADMLEQRGDHAAATAWYRRGLGAATGEPAAEAAKLETGRRT